MKHAYAAVLTLFAIVVPLRAQTGPHSAPIEILHGKPYVKVMVNGRGPFRFLLDTGTGGNAIVTPELATLLDLPPAGEGTLDDPSGRSAQAAPMRRVATLTVAGVEFYAVHAFEHQLLNPDGPCDGILGFPLFKGLLLTLDYPRGLVTLDDGELEPDGGHTVHPFRMTESVPIADLTLGDLQVSALLDSGGAGLSFPKDLAPQLSFLDAPAVFAHAQSLSSRFPIEIARLATDVRLGDITFVQPWVEINPAFPLANFGSVPMQHFAITFDQENLLVRLVGPRNRITLGVTPAPVHLINAPSLKPDTKLVPIG